MRNSKNRPTGGRFGAANALAVLAMIALAHAALAEAAPMPTPLTAEEAVTFIKTVHDSLPKKGASGDALFAAYRKLFKDAPTPPASALLSEFDLPEPRAKIERGEIEFKGLSAKGRKAGAILAELEIAEPGGCSKRELVIETAKEKDKLLIVAERKPKEGEGKSFEPIPVAGGPLKFPADRSLGKLRYYDFKATAWKEIGEAKGEVAVPAGQEIVLALSQEGANDLSPLDQLAPDALQSLSFENVEVRGDQLVHLKALAKLRKLGFRSAKLADADLAHLAPLKELQELDLGVSTVGDAGIEKLKVLTKLQTLDISYTKAGNACVETLKSMTSLTYLDPQRTEIKPEKLDELSEALPGCTIVTR